ADRYLRRQLYTSPYRNARNEEYWQAPPRLPCELPSDARVERIVRVGQGRLGRALRIPSAWSLVSWGVVLLATAMLGYALWRSWDADVSVAGLLRGLATRLAGRLESAVPLPVDRWTERLLPLGPAALVLVGAVAAVMFLRRILRFRLAEWLREKGFLQAGRRVATIAKWARATSGNLLWALAGAPLWIAVGSALLAAVSYVFFHLPFMGATRLRRPGWNRSS
ncbi:MAG TPA: hypothetical protein VFH97_03345, partial [Gemmatimonadales bacterium]|nr:hypothetical protein [Gemmatimonadales bacterium]